MHFLSQFDTKLISVSAVKESIDKEYHFYTENLPSCHHCGILIDINLESDSVVFMLLVNVWGEKQLLHYPFCDQSHAEIWHEEFYKLSQEEAINEIGNRLWKRANKNARRN